MSLNHGPRLQGLRDLVSGRPYLLAVPVVVIVAAVAIVLATSGGGGGGGNNSPSGEDHVLGGLQTAEPTVEATIDLNRPTVLPTADLNPQEVGAGDRFIIRKYGVDAPLTLRNVGLDGVMPNPEGPDDIAIYNFSAWPGKGGTPGKGGNTIVAGHVDSGSKPCKNGTVQPPCQAVLWDLSGLRNGDEIEMNYGGQTYKYRVTSNQPVSAANGPWDQIVSSTQQESITIITCGGDFNRQTREYSNRQVVTAIRV